MSNCSWCSAVSLLTITVFPVSSSSSVSRRAPLVLRFLATSGWTRSISPQLVNTLHVGWNKGNWRRTAEFIDPNKGSTTNFSKELGLQNTSTSPFQWSVPGVSMVGFTFLGASFSSLGDTDQNYQISDTLIYTRGKHNMRFGGNYRRQKYLGITASGGPQLTFNGNYTGP